MKVGDQVWAVNPSALHEKGKEILVTGTVEFIGPQIVIRVIPQATPKSTVICDPALAFPDKVAAVAHAQALVNSHRRALDYTRMLAMGRLHLVDESLR
jgi:dTDP-D-glucose 4,6-dehydratase